MALVSMYIDTKARKKTALGEFARKILTPPMLLDRVRGQVLKPIWYFFSGCWLLLFSFPFPSPARSGGERSEPERSAGEGKFHFKVSRRGGASRAVWPIPRPCAAGGGCINGFRHGSFSWPPA